MQLEKTIEFFWNLHMFLSSPLFIPACIVSDAKGTDGKVASAGEQGPPPALAH